LRRFGGIIPLAAGTRSWNRLPGGSMESVTERRDNSIYVFKINDINDDSKQKQPLCAVFHSESAGKARHYVTDR
jgi:hypothetical protein